MAKRTSTRPQATKALGKKSEPMTKPRPRDARPLTAETAGPGELAATDPPPRPPEIGRVDPPPPIFAPQARPVPAPTDEAPPAPVEAKQTVPTGADGQATETQATETVLEPAVQTAPPPAGEAPAHQTGAAPPAASESPQIVPQPPLLFECAWEVCWQLGGIYTVLRTKAAAMLERWGDRYCLIGPYNPNTAPLEFEEQPTYGSIREAIQRLRDGGLNCYFGRWLIPGRPRVILIDYRSRYATLEKDKYLMWKDHGIETYASDGEVNEVCAFGFAVAEFFRVFTDIVKDRPILAHFHEWMAGLAVPRIAHLRLPIGTIFTTHATLLGRYIASENPYFYDHLPFLNPEYEANKYRILPRYQIEKAATHASTVFTTVSEVTSTEADRLLGRNPDGILPNGLNIQRFAAPHEFQYLHQKYKEKINEFVMGHFFPSYTFDLENTLYLFTSGRYEYRNKGMDLFIEAMARLNHQLKHVPSPPTIVAFIITKAAVRNINVGVLQNQSMFDELRNTCTDVQERMGANLFRSAAAGRLPTYGELLPEDAQVRLKRALHAWRSNRQPVIVTHDLVDDANDPVLKHLRHCGLFNAADDPVKIVFHPDFVTATSPLIALDYEHFVRGCHMGIFPSYYEPWGYTPMETIALGLPAVTTDLSGFGAYVERHVPGQHKRGIPGIAVLNRRTSSFDGTADALVDHLMRFVQLQRRERIELRNRVERLGELFDWSNLARHYEAAHDLALQRIGVANQGVVDVKLV
jgi:glycogen(starch) synthase